MGFVVFKSRSILILFAILSFSALAGEIDVYHQYRDIEDVEGTRPTIAKTEADHIFWQVARHPVAAISQLGKYDFQSIGFCFGRAMAAHLLARQRGLESQAVSKLFIIGDLGEWRFHVTTLLNVGEKEPYAIDPALEYLSPPVRGAIPVGEWIRRVRETWDPTGKAALYWVSNAAIIPDIHVVPIVESAERIIEVSFRAADHDGFTATQLGNVTAFRLTDKTQSQHFIQASGDDDDISRFNFESIRVLDENGNLQGDFRYNNYFVDLLNAFQRKLSARTLIKPGWRWSEPSLFSWRLERQVP